MNWTAREHPLDQWARRTALWAVLAMAAALLWVGLTMGSPWMTSSPSTSPTDPTAARSTR